MSINDENPFDKFQHLFMIKKQQKKETSQQNKNTV